MSSKAREERTAEVLEVISMLEDGARPIDLSNKLGISNVYGALILSRFKKKGYVIKRLSEDGRCRYCLSDRGERKKAFLESLKEY